MSSPSPMATPMPWDLVSGTYADEIVPVFEQYARDALRLAAPPAGGRIVDVACGPGTLSLLAAGDGLIVDGLDFSPKMVAAFEARKATAGTKRVNVQVGDGQALPFANGTFAAGFSMFGLMFFPDRAKGFAELRRVLVPGARAVVSSWIRLEENPVLSAMFTAIRAAMSKVMGPAAPQPGSADMPLTTEDACRLEMSASFADVEIHRITHGQTFPSIEAVWPSIERTMAPFVLMRRMLGEAKWAVVAEAGAAAIVDAMAGAPPVIELPAWLSVGTAR